MNVEHAREVAVDSHTGISMRFVQQWDLMPNISQCPHCKRVKITRQMDESTPVPEWIPFGPMCGECRQRAGIR